MYYWLFNDSIPLQYDVGVIQVCIVYFLSSTLLFMMTFANHGLESDFVLKLIILGETDAGKTCLVTRFLHHTFVEYPAHVRLYQYDFSYRPF